MWYLRLSCLARMRLYNQASAECSNLFAILQNIEPEEARRMLFDHVLPFELEVFRTRLPLWANDPLAYLSALHLLLSKCKRNAQEAADPAVVETWEERASRITLIIVSQLIEMKVGFWCLSNYRRLANDIVGVCDSLWDPGIALREWLG